MGRLVEQKRDAPTARVELLGGEGAMEDFPDQVDLPSSPTST